MKILKLSYWDLDAGWSIDSCEFFPDLNLLVGISGAGKTSILGAINHLKYIANDKPFKRVKWSVEFLILSDVLYCWSGETGIDTNTNKFEIVGENIIKTQNNNSEVIVKRERDRAIFTDSETTNLSPDQSIIQQKEDLLCLKESFKNIILNYVDLRGSHGRIFLASSLHKEAVDYEKLISEDPCTPLLDITTKLFLVCRYNEKVFDSIKEKFLNVFSQVEDIRIDSQDTPFPIPSLERYGNSTNLGYNVQIKEKNSEQWIYNISSGMVKSLLYLATIELSPRDNIIMIDEFENSLGVNCLDGLVETLLDTYGSKDLQLIITSHHPYIINNISPGHWKIITRKDGVITARNAEDYHIPKSRHKAFLELINVLKDFPEGPDEE